MKLYYFNGHENILFTECADEEVADHLLSPCVKMPDPVLITAGDKIYLLREGIPYIVPPIAGYDKGIVGIQRIASFYKSNYPMFWMRIFNDESSLSSAYTLYIATVNGANHRMMSKILYECVLLAISVQFYSIYTNYDHAQHRFVEIPKSEYQIHTVIELMNRVVDNGALHPEIKLILDDENYQESNLGVSERLIILIEVMRFVYNKNEESLVASILGRCFKLIETNYNERHLWYDRQKKLNAMFHAILRNHMNVEDLVGECVVPLP